MAVRNACRSMLIAWFVLWQSHFVHQGQKIRLQNSDLPRKGAWRKVVM
jgi:hypothetical protein